MFRILVDETELQKVYHVQKTGRYLGQGTIVWDERSDGSIPPALVQYIGGLARVDNQLTLDQAKFDAYQSLISDRASQEQARKNRVQQAQDLLRTVDLSGTLTSTQIQNILKALVIIARAT